MSKKSVCLLFALMTVFVIAPAAQAQMIRQRGVLGVLGIETPAMRSARQQAAVAKNLNAQTEKMRKEAAEAQTSAKAAQGAVQEMMGVVRSELKSSIDETKKEAVAASKEIEEAKQLRAQARKMKEDAEKEMAEAHAAKEGAIKAMSEAKTARENAEGIKKFAEEMKQKADQQLVELKAKQEELKKAQDDLEKAKKEHEDQKNKDQKELEQKISALNAKQEEPKPKIVVEKTDEAK